MTRAGWVNVAAGDCDEAEEKIQLMVNQFKAVSGKSRGVRASWRSECLSGRQMVDERRLPMQI